VESRLQPLNTDPRGFHAAILSGTAQTDKSLDGRFSGYIYNPDAVKSRLHFRACLMSATGKNDWISEQEIRDATGISRRNLVRWRRQGLLPLPTRSFSGRGTGSTSVYPAITVPMVRRLEELRQQSPHNVDGWTWALWLDGFPIDIRKWCDDHLARAGQEIARMGSRDALQAAFDQLTAAPASRSEVRRPLVSRLSSRQERSLWSWTADVMSGAASAKSLYDLASPAFDALKRAAGLVGVWSPPDPELHLENLSLTTLGTILSEATSAEMETARQDCRELERLATATGAVDWRSARKHLGVERGRSAQPVAPIDFLVPLWRSPKHRAALLPGLITFDEAKVTRYA
jgi:hypothetical protein